MRRERATDAAAIVVAWSFAVAQPLLEVLGKNPEFFVAHGSTKLDILGVALTLLLVAPAVLAGIVLLVGVASRPVGRVVHRVVLGLLLAEFALQLLENVGGLPASVLLGLSLAFGAGGAWLYDRRDGIRSTTWWFLPAPLLFLALFLTGPVNGLLFTDAVAAGPGVTIDDPKPVVLVVFDEMPVISLMRPDGTLDRDAYPNFARLADRSVWFRNTTADWPNTERSVPTILTGDIDTGQVATASANPKSIFTLLGGAYRVEGWEPVTQLCPESLCGSATSGVSTADRLDRLVDDTRIVAGHVLLPSALASGLPPVDRSWGDFGGSGSGSGEPRGSASATVGKSDDVAGPGHSTAPAGSRRAKANNDPPAAIGELTRTMARDGARSLYVMHVEIPHFPWRYLPDGRQYGSADDLPGYVGPRWSDDDRLTDLGLARHLLQVRYVDHLLGEVLDAMDATGLSKDATLVVTADHGAAFEPGEPRRDPDEAVLGDIAYVPLFVSTPGQAARVDDRPANLDDVVPTIAASLGVHADGWTWSGSSLLGRADPTRARSMGTMGDETFRLADDARERDAALARRWARHPGLTTLADWQQLFHVGPLGSLVGAAPPATTPLTGAQLELDQRAELDAYDPDAALAPVMLTGTVTGLPSGRDVAIVVDGVVAGTGRTYGDDAFTGLVSPGALHAGANDVTALTRTDDGEYRSVAVGGTERWTLAKAADGSVTVANGGGAHAPVTPDRVTGYVTVDRDGATTSVHGWAADVADPAAKPVHVVVFRGTEYLGATRTGSPRADVAAKKGPDYLNSGFTLTLPGTAGGRGARVTAYAVSGSDASPLTVIP